jgi:hypothetical protein
MEFIEMMVQKFGGSFAALAGAVIGGVFTLRATNKAVQMENAKELRRDEKEVQNLLEALGVEIRILLEFHQRRIGYKVEQLPEGEPLACYYPLTQDYFTIYNANAAMIGRIKNPDLREAIVICYNKCKKVVDAFKYNNDLYIEYRNLLNDDSSPRTDKMIAHKRQELVDYAVVIKEDHYELQGYVERMMALLTQHA